MLRSFLLVAFTCLLLSPAFAAERFFGHQSARISVDREGRIARLEWVDSTLSAAMLDVLAARVRKVEFEPAMVDGVPAEAESTLHLRLEAKVVDANLSLHIDGVDVTAGIEPGTPPRYPPQMLRRGKTAVVKLRIEFDGSGRVTHIEPFDPDAPEDEFLRAATKAAKHWKFYPERVAGIGIAGTAIVPVRFSIQTGPRTTTGSGALEFKDGGVLHIYREGAPELTQLQMLAEPRLRLRSTEGALDIGS